MIYWIFIPIAILSAAICIAVIGRHWKEIQLLDPNSIKEERLRQKRDELIQQRFNRLRSESFAPFKAFFKHVTLAIKRAFHAGYLKLLQLDRFYKQAKAPITRLSPSVQDRIRAALDEARSLSRDLKWGDAERRFLEILTIDERNVDAYKGLASMYLKQRLYPQAKETFHFLVRIKKADASCYEGLGHIAEVEKDLVTAEAMFRKALELQPRQAHRHAVLAEFYLTHDDAGKALPLARRASDLEPKSGRFLELAIEACICSGNREEARRKYDKLRLVFDDRQKLQSLKERIDGMPS